MLYIQRAGYILRQLNDKFYFHIDIDTMISWTVIIIMYLLYKLIDKYFKDQKLDSFELVKLLGIYLVILTVIMASYIDVGEIRQRANPQYSFFIIVLIVLFIVIAMSWASREPGTERTNVQKRVILISLYAPIILLMLTNGRILERRSESLGSLLPRSDISFLDLPGEITKLKVGGEVLADQRDKLEEIINSHRDVSESAVVGRRDGDNLIKPYAYVVLESDVKASGDMEEEIITYVSDRVESDWISPGMYPSEIEFVDKAKLQKMGAGGIQQQKVRKIIKEHRSVADCRVIGPPEKSVAYVVLKEGVPPSREQARDIYRMTYTKIKDNNRISDYLVPRWVEFVEADRIPKDSRGQFKRNILQKRAKNWSDLFPEPPEDDAFVRGFESQM